MKGCLVTLYKRNNFSGIRSQISLICMNISRPTYTVFHFCLNESCSFKGRTKDCIYVYINIIKAYHMHFNKGFFFKNFVKIQIKIVWFKDPKCRTNICKRLIHKNVQNWLYFSGEHSSPWVLVSAFFRICSDFSVSPYHVLSSLVTYYQTFNKSNMMDASSGAGTTYILLEELSSSLVFTWLSVALVLCVLFCWPLFVFLSFFCRPLYCLFFDLRLLIIIASNFS